jgi:hypothetical protein
MRSTSDTIQLDLRILQSIINLIQLFLQLLKLPTKLFNLLWIHNRVVGEKFHLMINHRDPNIGGGIAMIKQNLAVRP